MEEMNIADALYWHECRSSISICEIKELYGTCELDVLLGYYELAIKDCSIRTPSDSKSRKTDITIAIPSIGIARGEKKHYLPLQELLGDGDPMLLFGYNLTFLLARTFGVAKNKNGIYPCYFGENFGLSTIIFSHELERTTPKALLFYSDSKALTKNAKKMNLSYLSMTINGKQIYAVPILLEQIGQLTPFSMREAIDYLADSVRIVEEAEYLMANTSR